MKEEGITLQSIPYKEKTRIVTVFTKNSGIVSIIIKNLSIKKPNFFAINNPFCISNLVCQKGRSDIYLLKDFLTPPIYL